MFFNQEQIAFEILEIVKIDQSHEVVHNKNRHYDALSFRFDSDTVIESPGKSFALSGGSLCFVPASVNYTRTSKKDELIVIHFKTFNLNTNEIEVMTTQNPEAYKELFLQAYKCWQEGERGYAHECGATFCKILALIHKEQAQKRHVSDKISKAVQYLDDSCLKKDCSVQAVAKQAFMSEVYFRKLFKQEFGISPKRYLTNLRMKHASALLLSGHFTVQEVADKCGYEDSKHFSVIFKKMFGISPSEYNYNYKKQ